MDVVMRLRDVLRNDRGGVAAEFAVALPAILLVLILVLSAVSAQTQRALLQDAVADAARLVSRGDDGGRAIAHVTAAVAGADVRIDSGGELVCVHASASVAWPWGTVNASGCALSGGR